MDINTFPYEIWSRIIEFCPDHIQYSLLKSRSLAPLAYKHFYKRVSINEDEIAEYSLTFQYTGLAVPIDNQIPPAFQCHRNFFDAKALSIFHKTHPLYDPDTIIISSNEQLEDLKQIGHGFLEKFKHIEYYPSQSNSSLSPKFNNLPFRLFVSYSSNIPLSMYRLVLMDCDFSAPTSVRQLELKGVPVDFAALKKLPHLKKLALVGYGDVVVDLPNLRSLIIAVNSGIADISSCVELEDLIILNCYQDFTIGFDEDDTYCIPHNLKFLLLIDVIYCPTFAKFSRFDTLKFLQITLNVMCPDFEDISFPPNLTGLIIRSEDQRVSCNPFNVPKQLTYLELVGLELPFDVKFPESLIYLDLRWSEYTQIDLSPLKNLNSLYVNTVDVGEIPQLINKLQTVNDTNLDYSRFRNLKTIQFEGEQTLLQLPNLLTLVRCAIEDFYGLKGAVNLQELSLLIIFPVNSLKWNFKMLTSLALAVSELVMLCEEVLPKTLQFLQLVNVEMKRPLINPPHLKFLSLENCGLPAIPVLNNELEVLKINDMALDGTKLFKSPPKELKYLILQSCFMGKTKADFRKTNLEYISFEAVDFECTQIRFPKTLQRLRYLDSNDDSYPRNKVFDWIDISESNHLCELFLPNVEFEKPKNIKKLQKLVDIASKKVLL